MTIRRLLLLVILGGCRSARTPDLGDLLIAMGGPLPSDSTVLARLATAHACQVTLPPVRLGADSVPSPARCILLSTALATIEEHRGAPEVFAGPPFSLAKATCATIRQEAYRNARTGTIDMPRWTIELLSDHQPSYAVAIDRITGNAQAFRILPEFGFAASEICARAT